MSFAPRYIFLDCHSERFILYLSLYSLFLKSELQVQLKLCGGLILQNLMIKRKEKVIMPKLGFNLVPNSIKALHRPLRDSTYKQQISQQIKSVNHFFIKLVYTYAAYLYTKVLQNSNPQGNQTRL